MSIPLNGTLVLVGAGKMGGAMLEGWLNSGVDPKNIAVLDPHAAPEMVALLTKHSVRLNPVVTSIQNVAVILVAVKPQIMDEVLPPLASLGQSKPLILSIVAGKKISRFAEHFGADCAIIRTIPNTPASIGRGITAITANANVSPAQHTLAIALLEAIGEVVTVENEDLIDAATALSGSGPAYIFYLTECMAEAGEKLGLPKDLAMQLARATVSGAGELMRQSGTDAAILRQNVTSPKGTTYAALQVLMADDGMGPLFDKATAAARDRAKELAS
jgi:pyrroline-5-carboxylate reductase